MCLITGISQIYNTTTDLSWLLAKLQMFPSFSFRKIPTFRARIARFVAAALLRCLVFCYSDLDAVNFSMLICKLEPQNILRLFLEKFF